MNIAGVGWLVGWLVIVGVGGGGALKKRDLIELTGWVCMFEDRYPRCTVCATDTKNHNEQFESILPWEEEEKNNPCFNLQRTNKHKTIT